MTAQADLGNTFFAGGLRLFAGYTDPEAVEVDAGAVCMTNVVEPVLLLDVTVSMYDRVGGQRLLGLRRTLQAEGGAAGWSVHKTGRRPGGQ